LPWSMWPAVPMMILFDMLPILSGFFPDAVLWEIGIVRG